MAFHLSWYLIRSALVGIVWAVLGRRLRERFTKLALQSIGLGWLEARVLLRGLSFLAKTVIASFIYLSQDGPIVSMLPMFNTF